MDQASPSVFIVDDHAVVSEGLQLYLEAAGMTVLGRSASGREAVQRVEKLGPQVVLLDVAMPDMDGLETLTAIKRARPETIVIMVTAVSNLDTMASAVAGGASGYVLKDTSLKGIPHVIRAAVAGHSIVDAAMLRAALRAGPSLTPPKIGSGSGMRPLTRQELRVLALIVQGLDNEAIAEELVISRNTVKTHVRKILRKLGVADRTQAAVWAQRHGIIQEG
jgi:DNA-binding NarL/FixJ family response regulator